MLSFICPLLEWMGFTFESVEVNQSYDFFKEVVTKAVEERKKQKVRHGYTTLENMPHSVYLCHYTCDTYVMF